MAIGTSDSDEVMSDINVTPLVDVMLVLLVVFMVTAPLLTNAVKVSLPQTAATSALEAKKAVTISVDAQGRVYLDKGELALPALESELRRLHAAQPDVAVHLSADQSSNYGLVANVITSIDRAGISRLSVLTVPRP